MKEIDPFLNGASETAAGFESWGEWLFARQQQCSECTDPYDDRHFQDDVDEDDYCGIRSLVRESIQNSLDAQDPESTEPVRVLFRIGTLNWDEENQKRIHSLFARLEGPLKEFGFSLQDGMRQPMKYLVCEDFNTIGLNGSVDRIIRQSEPNAAEEHFYWFWRNSGRSGKRGGTGRWGLGKTVFNAASLVHTRFGLTLRKSDRKRFLMGKSVLKLHEFEGNHYEAYGFWCRKDENCDPQADRMPLPVDDETAIQEFSQFWGLTRTNDPGLSLVVPFLQNISPKRLVQLTIGNYFVKILQGKLTVEIHGEGKPILINAQTMNSLVKKYFDPKKENGKTLNRFIYFAENLELFQKCLGGKVLVREIEIPGENVPNEPLLKNAMGSALTSWREEFFLGKILGFRLRFRLPHSEENDLWGYGTVFIQKDANAKKDDFYFTRNGMLLPKPKGVPGIRGLFLADESDPDDHLSRFLGDSEEPAHENWESQRLEGKKWQRGFKGRVGFVANIAKTLNKILQFENRKADLNAFASFFPDTRNISASAGKANSSIARSKEKLKEAPGPLIRKWYEIQKQTGGFRICSTGMPIPPNAALEIEAAYYVEKGNPFRSWNELDFSFYKKINQKNTASCRLNEKTFRFSSENANCLIPSLAQGIKGNVLKIQILPSEKFSFKISGFDPNRDVYVDVRDISSEEEEDLNEASLH
ncbi:MAG: hypothetical protein J6A23_11015 [Thermoguttaceae bacterium]|nr:hypothetical protein [Thermoguttaceae bacterium]